MNENLMNPLVSILIPVYNAGSYLTETLDSCIRQTFQNWEVIAVDDGSTDCSIELLNRYAGEDSRIHVIAQKNQGANVARRSALLQALGEFVCFLDADDAMPPDALDQLLTKAKKDEADMVIGSFYFQEKGRGAVFVSSSPFGERKVDLMCSTLSEGGFMPSLWGKLIGRELLSKIELIDDLVIGEDAVAIYQLIDSAKKIVFVPDIVYTYIQRENSISRHLNEERRNSIIKFCLWTSEFFSTKGYFESAQFQNSYAEHVLMAYYRFLREGGSVKYNPFFTRKINSIFLTNRWARKRTPFWRISLLEIYRFSPAVGDIYRIVLNIVRYIYKKMK